MENNAKLNLLDFTYSLHLSEAFKKWGENQDKSFLYCWKEVLKEFPISSFDDNNNKLNIPPREYLQAALKSLKSSVAAQTFCYAYETLAKNYEPSLSEGKTTFEQLKTKILTAPKNFNNEQLLGFIRNAISHNNDIDTAPSYNYDKIREVFTFLPTKKRQNGDSTQVTISQKELFELITIYGKNMLEQDSQKFNLNFDMDKAKSNMLISKIVNSLRLKRIDSGTTIYPDEHQKKVLYQLVEQVRKGKIIDSENLSLYYPFKQNCKINFAKFLNFYALIENLYTYRGLDFKTYIGEVMEHSPTNLVEMKNFGDIENLFVSNRLFQIFSTMPNNVIHAQLSETKKHIMIGKLRNSIMHGTYFFDLKNGSLFTYDAPKNQKTEEELSFVDEYSYEDISRLLIVFVAAKAKNINDFSSQQTPPANPTTPSK